jgi:hypothetical protein
MSGDDILTDLWRRLAPVIGHAAADRELFELRRRWGGCRIYVKKPPDCPRIAADPDSTRAAARPRKTWA